MSTRSGGEPVGGDWHGRLDAVHAMALLMEQTPPDALLRALVLRRIARDLAELEAGARVMAAEAERQARQDDLGPGAGSGVVVPVQTVDHHPRQSRGGGEWWLGQDPRMPGV